MGKARETSEVRTRSVPSPKNGSVNDVMCPSWNAVICREKKRPTSARAMIGARCVQLEGLYDQPRGTSGPVSMLIPGAIGIPGARMANTTTNAPTNVSLVGALVVVFASLAPGMPMAPGMSMETGPDVPRGWSYNPSSWTQRAPIIALALVGLFFSRQMTAFQLGHITSFTDPFFGLGTERVLTSDVSRAFPIPDAGLGAVAYMIEFLMGFMGDKARWRTMPWMVAFFGILVVPLGIVSITLIILQPIAVGAWSTPALAAAAAMLIMIALTLDEVAAMLQFLIQERQEGQSLWRVFWQGGTLREMPEAAAVIVRPDVARPMAMFWGVSLPWNLIVSAALGLWLMFAPSVLGSGGMAAHSDHLVGALTLTVAVIALSEVGRATRFVNVLFGAWMIASPWLLDGATTGATWSDAIAGVLVIVLSIPRGPVGERYGSVERFIR